MEKTEVSGVTWCDQNDSVVPPWENKYLWSMRLIHIRINAGMKTLLFMVNVDNLHEI